MSGRLINSKCQNAEATSDLFLSTVKRFFLDAFLEVYVRWVEQTATALSEMIFSLLMEFYIYICIYIYVICASHHVNPNKKKKDFVHFEKCVLQKRESHQMQGPTAKSK